MTIPDYYGELIFDDREMQKRLPKEVYDAVHSATMEEHRLHSADAAIVAKAMRDWAVEKGATHYTHWFQPMTGVTAEKHECFIAVQADGGVIMDFSGKELIRGESDASSFPSGGLRTTFEARGYTVWDVSSYAFIKDRTLCIPTAFCSYTGEALDKKTPLLRSMTALNIQALRILRLFGNTEVKKVTPMVGAEQEYFLIDRKMFDKRKDLIYTGRTLFGAKPPKGQEMDDHYYGALKIQVAAFMEDLNHELWRLGIPAKTEHNEVAPGQHELACTYAAANVTTDQNQIVMEMMRKIASKYGLVCLLHEKPFACVSGSGKHNNWSLATDTGMNLLSPGDTPAENAQFLLFLMAVIQAVDDYQDLLRISVASAPNDHRLGANEAPPAVISVFLGSEISAILDAIEEDRPYTNENGGRRVMKLGSDVMPRFPLDSTDRNRTSPFAFTGNKFEFRSVGSSDSIACANIMLNTAVADSLRQYADILENAGNFDEALHGLIQKTVKAHKRILFNGNGYDDAWIKEATEKRGLSNYKTTPDALPHYTDEKNVTLLSRHNVLNGIEIQSRGDILLDNYVKTVTIEARTMLEMAQKEIAPSIDRYIFTLADTADKKIRMNMGVSTRHEARLVKKLSLLVDEIDANVDHLQRELDSLEKIEGNLPCACYIRDRIIPAMDALRKPCDEAEVLTDRTYWPFPTYGDLFFSVN